MDFRTSNNHFKVAGAVGAAALLVVVGVVALNNTPSAQQFSLQHAQAVAKIQNANTPLSQLPKESDVHTPEGWEIESDKPVDESGADDGAPEQVSDDFDQNGLEEDDDIDSPLRIEEDKNGEEFVAEFDPEVIRRGDKNEEGEEIAADGQGYKKCFKNLKTCGAKKSCDRKCTRKCKPYAIRKCVPKKFCRCFCKNYGHIKKAKKCVVYQRLLCKHWRVFRCRRNCKKFCTKVPHCYCCPRSHIRRKCRRLCKRNTYRSKCARCRCLKLKCYKTCRFVCVKKYKH